MGYGAAEINDDKAVCEKINLRSGSNFRAVMQKAYELAIAVERADFSQHCQGGSQEGQAENAA